MIVAGRNEKIIAFAESIGLKTERLHRFSIAFALGDLVIVSAEYVFTEEGMDELQRLTREYKLVEIE